MATAALPLQGIFNSFAAKAYKSPHITDNDAIKSFTGTRQVFGVGLICFSGEGQVNGEAPAYYVKDENNCLVEGVRTLDMFA